MSTRCAIGMKRENGEVAAIYCHNDGYPEGVGAILGRWYRNAEKVEALLKLGSISSLGAKLEPEAGAEHAFFNRHRMSPTPTIEIAKIRKQAQQSIQV